MNQYKTRPRIVTAAQWDPKKAGDMWFAENFDYTGTYHAHTNSFKHLVLQLMRINYYKTFALAPGDWLIQDGPNFRVCIYEMFDQEFEPV